MSMPRSRLFLRFSAALLCSCAAMLSQAEDVKTTYANLSMGTLVQASVWAPTKEQGDRLTDLLDAELTRLAKAFTVHDAGPLHTANQQSGQWVKTPCEVATLVDTAKLVARESGGAFDPSIGALVNAWKIGFGGNQVPSAEELEGAKRRVDYRRIETDTTPDACRIRLGAEQSIDLGGIAKGYIGTAIAKRLVEAGATKVLLNLGGNVAMDGKSTWRIGIQDPTSERNDFFAVANLRGRVSAITSGAYERKMTVNGKTYGHILDAKTGYPVETAWSSVTIIDEDGAVADAWCTAFFAMPKDAVLSYVSAHPKMRVFLLEKDGKSAWVSCALAPDLEVHSERLTLNLIP